MEYDGAGGDDLHQVTTGMNWSNDQTTVLLFFLLKYEQSTLI